MPVSRNRHPVGACPSVALELELHSCQELCVLDATRIVERDLTIGRQGQRIILPEQRSSTDREGGVVLIRAPHFYGVDGHFASLLVDIDLRLSPALGQLLAKINLAMEHFPVLDWPIAGEEVHSDLVAELARGLLFVASFATQRQRTVGLPGAAKAKAAKVFSDLECAAQRTGFELALEMTGTSESLPVLVALKRHAQAYPLCRKRRTTRPSCRQPARPRRSSQRRLPMYRQPTPDRTEPVWNCRWR